LNRPGGGTGGALAAMAALVLIVIVAFLVPALHVMFLQWGW